MALINSLCAMLRITPFHRENYSRLILGVIIQFYQRCSDRFHDLVSLPEIDENETEIRLALSAQWAQRSEMSPCLSELSSAMVSRLDHLRPQNLMSNDGNRNQTVFSNIRCAARKAIWNSNYSGMGPLPRGTWSCRQEMCLPWGASTAVL
jgi:hypothetical protein